MSDAPALSPLEAFTAALTGVVAQAAPYLVSVHSHRSRASGFVWRPGLIVTSDEALAEEGEISVTLPGGETVAASLAGRDPTTDIALLRVQTKQTAPVTLASGEIAAGGIVVATGAEAGQPTAALGVIAVRGPAWRSMRGGDIDARIELDVRLRRSSEGGLVFDAGGRAFGMSVFGPRRRVLVIPAATIERVAARLESHGRIARGYLGLGLQPVRLDDGGAGAMVMSVDASGPGASAGVLQGDVITAWNGQPLRGVQSLLRALGPASVGTETKVTLKRAGEVRDITLTVGERPEG